MRTSHRLLAAAAVAALALPALAQDVVPQANIAAPAPTPAPTPAPSPTTSTTATAPDSVGESDTGVVEVSSQQAAAQTPAAAPAVEYPNYARRDPRLVGRLDPVDLGLGASPFKGASGAFAATLVPAGGTVTTAPLPPGIHRYECLIHPWMQTTVTVG